MKRVIGIGETVLDILFKDDQASRIAMAQRWSQDVCCRIDNNISDELAAWLKNNF